MKQWNPTVAKPWGSTDNGRCTAEIGLVYETGSESR